MLKKVVKKDGRKEDFIPEKIVVSVIKSGAPSELGRKIAQTIEKLDKEPIESKEIRECVLESLRAVNPSYENNWRSYDKAAKRLYSQYKDGLYSWVILTTNFK